MHILGLTFIPIEDMTKQLIELDLHVLQHNSRLVYWWLKILESDNSLLKYY